MLAQVASPMPAESIANVITLRFRCMVSSPENNCRRGCARAPVCRRAQAPASRTRACPHGRATVSERAPAVYVFMPNRSHECCDAAFHTCESVQMAFDRVETMLHKYSPGEAPVGVSTNARITHDAH